MPAPLLRLAIYVLGDQGRARRPFLCPSLARPTRDGNGPEILLSDRFYPIKIGIWDNFFYPRVCKWVQISTQRVDGYGYEYILTTPVYPWVNYNRHSYTYTLIITIKYTYI